MDIVKIKRVNLYTAICENAQECWEALQKMREANIQFVHLHYRDDQEIPNVVKPLSTWNYFDGEEYFNRELDRFPIVHWETYYDDGEGPRVNIAVGVDEIVNSQLWKNLGRVQ